MRVKICYTWRLKNETGYLAAPRKCNGKKKKSDSVAYTAKAKSQHNSV